MDIKVTIVGESPILMNNPASMRGVDVQGGKAPKVPTPEQEAAQKRYLSADGKHLVLWADHIKRCLVLSSSPYRVPGSRRSSMPFIAGNVSVRPDPIALLNPETGKPLPATAYEIDTRRCVLRTGRVAVMRSRPRVWPWAAQFMIWIDTDVFPLAFIEGPFRNEIFRDAGKKMGLLDYRPARGGEFGRFHVSEWVA